MPDLARLRMLIAIDDSGSISGAARSLRYTTAAVSQQISKLERETGVDLVIRHPRGVTVTPAGAELVSVAREVSALLAAAQDRAKQLAGVEQAKLRIATFQSASAGLLPRILRPLCQRFPRMRMEFVQVPRSEAVALVQRHQADVALIHEHPELAGGDDTTGLSIELLREDALRWVAAPSHSKAHRPGPIDLADLHDEQLIVGRIEDDDRQVLDEIFCEMRVRPNHIAEVGECFVAAAMASSGMAVTLMPEMAIPPGYSLVQKELVQHLMRRVFLVTRADDDSAAVAAFRNSAFHGVGAEAVSDRMYQVVKARV